MNLSKLRPWLAAVILSLAINASAAWKEKVLYSFQGLPDRIRSAVLDCVIDDSNCVAAEPFDIVQIFLEQTATLWRDFVVTRLSTATKAVLQIWYRT